LSPGSIARRLRKSGRSPARLAGLWRAHGLGLARRCSLCRLQWLPGGRRPHHVALARLGGRGVQSQHALRSIHRLATGGRPAPRQKAEIARRNQALQSAAKAVEEFELSFFPRPEGKSADQSEKVAKLTEIKAILKIAPAQRNRNQLDQLTKQWKEPAYLKTIQ